MIIDSVEIKGFWGTKKASAIINQIERKSIKCC